MGPTERHPAASPHVVDELVDRYGAEPAAARLARRIEELRARWVPSTDEALRLMPAFDLERDHVDGPPSALPTVVLFGAHGRRAIRRGKGLRTALLGMATVRSLT